MKNIIVLTLSLGLMAFAISTPLQNLTADEIVKNAEQKQQGGSSKGKVTIKIIRPKWSREMQMKTWSLGTEYSMTIVTAPAKEKGMGFLKRKNEVWNWIPNVDRLVKLPPSMMMQSWMGTDFTNDDLVRQSSIVDDYDSKLLGDTTIDEWPCWKIELIPHNDAPVVWGKVNMYIDKNHYLQLKTQFFDEDGYLVNTMKGSEVKEMDGKYVASRLEMIPAEESGKKTVFIQNSIDFDVDLEEDFFTPQQMKRIRP